ncbi:hypothetical protein PF002_g26003 [Phytophthora fragariae]|uniref:Uncharacterized protein n=2 Tax=Phytophthora TaxID=4783 RepID=A0A6A4BQY0_9STRA|nr:hypothetical protein PR002_g24806 [Phytophthora rubi]KAE9093415.1 hypothetical protein PF006_g24448 [Phytophthora fragariae]KAE9011822.1 hypothetical protein PR001_g15819 [Phytophthora rubi]KAE9186006.1 hypothetical protein PF002_g26003 [Phytophthora fragariae]KAE9277349.1 hypothetical protein PF001_g25695 [Phytophthora fragariae]
MHVGSMWSLGLALRRELPLLNLLLLSKPQQPRSRSLRPRHPAFQPSYCARGNA